MRIRAPGRDECFWITPGGGMESGETMDRCLKRELEEELGLRQFDVGPLVWLRQHTFNWGGERIRQSERYYIVQVERFEPKMSDAVEAQVLQQFRWWSMPELMKAEERLTPLSLATIVSGLVVVAAAPVALTTMAEPWIWRLTSSPPSSLLLSLTLTQSPWLPRMTSG